MRGLVAAGTGVGVVVVALARAFGAGVHEAGARSLSGALTVRRTVAVTSACVVDSRGLVTAGASGVLAARRTVAEMSLRTAGVGVD